MEKNTHSESNFDASELNSVKIHGFSRTLWLYDRQLVKVSNRLNDLQSDFL